MAPSDNTTLIGYYGAGNPGDDWLETQTKTLVTPTFTHSTTHKLKTYSYILKSNRVIFGGGSLFQDHTSRKSLYYYLSLLALALVFKKTSFSSATDFLSLNIRSP